jgi:hypothetical protein
MQSLEVGLVMIFSTFISTICSHMLAFFVQGDLAVHAEWGYAKPSNMSLSDQVLSQFILSLLGSSL